MGGRTDGAETDRRQAARLEKEIADLARRIWRETGAEGELPDRLELVVALSPSASGPGLAEQISRTVADAAAQRGAMRPGRAYCHRCRGAECEHSSPPRPTAVFAGYGPTGQPEWRDFSQLLLDLKDDRVEGLFRPRPAPVTVVQLGRELKSRLLRPFGRTSKSYDLLAQLAAGYFGDTRDSIFAVTLQAVEYRAPGGARRLALNALGVVAGERDPFPEALRDARREFAAMEESLATVRDPSEVLQKVPAVLHRIRRAIERSGRQRERRTDHVRERREQMRPTPAAVRDLREAPSSAIYTDEENDTRVVLGPRGRAHVFSPTGRHVTSFTIEREERDRRVRQNRWRPATADEAESLRRLLAGSYDPAT